jgi:hypothetical protein
MGSRGVADIVDPCRSLMAVEDVGDEMLVRLGCKVKDRTIHLCEMLMWGYSLL